MESAHVGEIYMTIYDQNGGFVDPMRNVILTNRTEGNWVTYHVIFVKAGDEDYIRQGARIVIDATRYPSGCRYEMLTPSRIIAMGRLFYRG